MFATKKKKDSKGKPKAAYEHSWQKSIKRETHLRKHVKKEEKAYLNGRPWPRREPCRLKQPWFKEKKQKGGSMGLKQMTMVAVEWKKILFLQVERAQRTE